MRDEQTTETPAPSELELLRAEMRAGFAEVRAGLAAAASATAMAAEFKAVRAEIAAEGEKSRRHMDVSVEGLRSEFQVVIDKTVATGKKVDRLIASNAIEHAAFQEFISDHEVRITRLETPPGSAPAAGDR